MCPIIRDDYLSLASPGIVKTLQLVLYLGDCDSWTNPLHFCLSQHFRSLVSETINHSIGYGPQAGFLRRTSLSSLAMDLMARIAEACPGDSWTTGTFSRLIATPM